MWLAKSDNSKIRFYSLSNQIFKEHKQYNNIIEETQKGTSDITKYVEWFLGCFERALLASEQNLEIILDNILKVFGWRFDNEAFEKRYLLK